MSILILTGPFKLNHRIEDQDMFGKMSIPSIFKINMSIYWLKERLHNRHLVVEYYCLKNRVFTRKIGSESSYLVATVCTSVF